MRRVPVAALALSLLPIVVRAHDTPVVPSTCTCDTIRLASQDGSQVVDVAPPPDGGAPLRLVYDAAAQGAQLQAHGVAPLAFALAGVPATLVLPEASWGALSERGDLAFPDPRAAGAPSFTIAVGEAVSTVAVAMTTGPAVIGPGAIVAGEPMGADGRFVLVGHLPTLPAPLGGGTLTLGCRVSPVPDFDRFRPAAQLDGLRGIVRGSGARLTARLEVPEASDGLGLPVVVAISTGGRLVASLVSDDLRFTSRGRRASFSTPEGALTLRRIGHAADARWRVDLRLRAGALPPDPPQDPLVITFAFGDTVVSSGVDAAGRRGGLLPR